MFKKLLSNLPFNPSLIGELSFYAHRVKKEAIVRQAGLIVLCIAIALQSLAIISPPQSSLARSNSDMIVGGFSSQTDALRNCTDNVRDYKTILGYYGIDCSDISRTSTVYIKSTDENKRLYTMGHIAYGKPGETPVEIPDAGTLYLRPLWSWDTNGPITFKALKGTTKDGTTFYLLYGCGNVTFIGIPKPAKVDVCPSIPGIQTSSSECDVCPTTPGVQSNANQCDLCPNLPGIQTTAQCDVCPNVSGIQSNVSQCDVCPRVDGIQTDKAACDICPNIPGEQSNENECKPCSSSQSKDDLRACLEYHKTVKNDTQGIADANNTTAAAGDTLTYTLTTTNRGKIDIKKYSVNENITDVLDYADIVDLHGGTKNDDNIVTWPQADIKADKSITVSFTVRVKNPIPSTPVSSSDPGHFDLTMTNVYGNTVSVKLPPPTIKVAEVVATTLPSTGPGTSMVILASIVVFAGYLFARSKLVAKELDIIRTDFVSTGAP